MIRLMEMQAARMLEALQKAYDVRPRDPEVEDRLLALLRRAQELRDGIRRARRELVKENTRLCQEEKEKQT